MTNLFIDRLEIKHWRQGYTLQIGIMRPSNAPRYRMTTADLHREQYVRKINSELVLSRRYFKSLGEIQEYVDALNRNPTIEIKEES